VLREMVATLAAAAATTTETTTTTTTTTTYLSKGRAVIVELLDEVRQ